MQRSWPRPIAPIFLAAVAWGSPPADAAELDCFDAEVTATITRQTPTDIPECDDCIIMRWPWFVDLNVERVHRGRAAKGTLTVLSVQHTYYRTDLGARRWFLRRNTLGGFNVVQLDVGRSLPHCSANSQPAQAYLVPAEGETLEEVRRELEERDRGNPDT